MHDPANRSPVPDSHAQATERVLCLQHLFSASITSAGRTEHRNVTLPGSSTNSHHLLHRGAWGWDLVPDSPDDVPRLAEAAYQLGFEAWIYERHVHLERPSSTMPPRPRHAAVQGGASTPTTA